MELSQKYLDSIGPEFKDYIPPSWDVLFMKMVYLASRKSKDTKTKIGAVIVGPDHEPISFGFNGLPRKVNDHVPERYERPKKYLFFEHAERNAIISVARMGGSSLKGCIMFTHGLPCADCGRAVIQSGITTVVTHEPWELIFAHLYDTWKDSCYATYEMFKEAGIETRTVKEFLGVQGFINGKIINV